MITSRSMGAPAAGGFRHRSRLTASGVPCRHDITPTARASRASRNARNIATLSRARHRVCDICGCPSLPADLCLKFAQDSKFRDRGPKVIDNAMDGVWTTPQFRKLLAEGRPGQALALVRKEMGLSQADFGALLHWDRTHAGRVERGEVGTIFDVRELVRAADALGIPRSALLPLLLATPDTGTIDYGGGEGVDDVDRRQFGLAATITAVAGVSIPPSKAAEPIRVGAGHVTYIRVLTQRLWEHDNQRGGGGVFDYAARQYASVRRLLDSKSYGHRLGAELVSATGWLSNTVAWLARDSNRPGTAWRHLTESVLLAEQCGDNALLAAALGDLANLAASSPASFAEPVRLARRSTELVRGIPSARMNALKAAEEAIAYAAVGDQQEFDRAMARVWREADRGLDSPDDPAWLEHVNEAELHAHEARGLRMLGHHGRAAELYRESVTHGSFFPRDETSYRAYFAAALAGLGDTAAAITEAHTALTLLEGPVNSPRLLAELRPVRGAATRTRGDDAEHFRHRFDTLARTA
ncbi:helix-turn-helix transcriptional regulator [Nocardia abscessus]|uniref:helix-turn-helix transcriptional regulator n=1 Tax=Nocardia abscessus TaxID=120957 RepID=UPI0024568648|nr:helix-turn-helix transcriptional regulator [Nocardia abscessus]